MKTLTKVLMVIDDLADRQHDCDLLLDQNAVEKMDRYQDLVPPSARLLLGPRYVLLRPYFNNYKKIEKNSNLQKRLLVSLGGGDSLSVLKKVIAACTNLKDPDLKIDIIIPPSERTKICNLEHSDSRFCYHENVANIAELMTSADLSIGAGGSTIWEKCYLGLPSIVMTTALNQEAGCHYLHKLGVIDYLGKAEEVGQAQITCTIESLLHDTEKLENMCMLGCQLIDGKGCERVVAAIKDFYV